MKKTTTDDGNQTNPQQIDIQNEAAEQELRKIGNENHKDLTNLVVTISWAVVMFFISFQSDSIAIMPLYGKILIVGLLLLFNFAIMLEFLAAVTITHGCKIADETQDIAAQFYFDFARIMINLRNVFFILGLILLLPIAFIMIFR